MREGRTERSTAGKGERIAYQAGKQGTGEEKRKANKRQEWLKQKKKKKKTNSWQEQQLLSITAEHFSFWKTYFRCGGGKMDGDKPTDLRWKKS